MKSMPGILLLCAAACFVISACSAADDSGPKPTQQIDAKAKPTHPAPTAMAGGPPPSAKPGGDKAAPGKAGDDKGGMKTPGAPGGKAGDKPAGGDAAKTSG